MLGKTTITVAALTFGVVLLCVRQNAEENAQDLYASPSTTSATASPPAAVPARAETKARVREVLHFCQAAQVSAVPELRRMARESRDPLVAGCAIRALSRLGRVAGDPEIRALVHDPRLRVRQEAIVALGASGTTAAVETLCPLVDEADSRVRSLVIQALGRLGGKAAHARLRAFLAAGNATRTEMVFAQAALRRMNHDV